MALTVEAGELAGAQLMTRLATSDAPDGLGSVSVGADGRVDLVLPARYGAVLLRS